MEQPVSAREVEDAHLIDVFWGLHEDDPEGGYRILSDDFTGLGYRLSERRLCHVAGIRSPITTRKHGYRKAGPPVHDDLVDRVFTMIGPNLVWLTDITEHWIGEFGASRRPRDGA